MRKTTPINIEYLEENQIFVFGSNANGFHSKGAALLAKENFGAIYGIPSGLQGQSYAIITKKNWKVKKSSSLKEIYNEIEKFLIFANKNRDYEFLVTKIGSSLAGYSKDEIKNIFYQLKHLISDNVILPIEYEIRDEI